MWPCQYCGHENDESATFCEKCGAPKEEMADAGCPLSDFGEDELWDDDQGLM